MTYRNPLCIDDACSSSMGCYHRGPQGQYCHFYAEQRICEVLGLEWNQRLTLEILIGKLQERLTPAHDDYNGQMKLAKESYAQRASTVPVLSLNGEDDGA